MRIAVLRGGVGDDYEASLASGAHVLTYLRESHDAHDVFIDRDGQWHRQGIPVWPSQLVPGTDVFVNALHGEYGEDGGVQRVLEGLRVPYTGPRTVPAASTWRKDMARKLLAHNDLAVPEGVLVDMEDDPQAVAHDLIARVGGQFVIKPAAGSNSRGVTIARSYLDLAPMITRAMLDYGRVLVEELLRGRELKCVVADDFRGQELYAFIPVEVDTGSDLRPYAPNEEHRIFAPARLMRDEMDLIMDTARRAHQALGLDGYSSVDIILTRRGPVVLEVDTLPPLSEGSIFSRSLSSVGATPAEFFNNLVTLI